VLSILAELTDSFSLILQNDLVVIQVGDVVALPNGTECRVVGILAPERNFGHFPARIVLTPVESWDAVLADPSRLQEVAQSTSSLTYTELQTLKPPQLKRPRRFACCAPEHSKMLATVLARYLDDWLGTQPPDVREALFPPRAPRSSTKPATAVAALEPAASDSTPQKRLSGILFYGFP